VLEIRMSLEDETPRRASTTTAAAPRDGEPKLSEYEALQVRAIAAWKARPPNPFAELFRKLAEPGAKWIERRIPDDLARKAVDRAYELASGMPDGVGRAERPLEACDAEAAKLGASADAIALVEGAVTGAGGVITTLVDIPLLFVLALRTIVRIGRSYGYPLRDEYDQRFVIGVLIAAVSGSLAVRRDRLSQLRDVEDLFLEETQEEIVTEEAASLLFQLEVFEGIPGVGAISGGLLNLAFIRRIQVTARRVFQERWLRDRAKVEVIAPDPVHARALVTGWAGTLGRTAYHGLYTTAFAAALPFWLAAALVRPRRSPGLQPAG
jgi:hypothetical protein